jgi:hypothetical protein
MLYCLSSRRHVVPVVSSVGEWLSLVEHLVRDQGVGGSNPLSPTIIDQHRHKFANLVTMNANENVTATFQPEPDFTISASAPTSVSPGGSATSTVTVGAINGFSGSVALTCSVSPLPDLAPQCSINPSSANPNTPATLTVTTTAPNLAGHPSGNPGSLFAASLPALDLTLLGVGLIPRRTRKPELLLSVLFSCYVLTSSALLVGCGGSNNSSKQSAGTPPGSYTIMLNVRQATWCTLQRLR